MTSNSPKNFDKAPVQKFGLQAEKPRSIYVYRLGEVKDEGTKVLLNKYKNLDQLKVDLAKILKFLPRLHPTKPLVSPDGKTTVESLDDLEDGKKYVAIRAGFKYETSKVPPAAFDKE